jgi:hypothetical protein
MKEYQFEELTASIATIIAILCYAFDLHFLFWLFASKAVLDWGGAIGFGFRDAIKKLKQKSQDNGKV